MKNGFWSSFHNQAALAYNNSLFFGFNYENRFNISELGTRSLGLIIPAGKASLGSSLFNIFGYTDFRRDMTGLACGLKLSNKISAGLQVDYFSVKTSGEYNNQSVTCEAGLLITPSENTRLGIHVFNPVPNSLRKIFPGQCH